MKARALACAVVMGMPVLWIVFASFRPEATLFEPGLGGGPLALAHYAAVFRDASLRTAIGNSLVVASASTLCCLILGTTAAYAIARLRFPGRRIVLALLLSVTMFPQVSIVAPLYLFLRSVGLIDTYAGLILPYLTFAMPLTVFLLVGYFRQLPEEVEQAALVDGASRLRAFREVTLPLAVPGLVTTAIITFIFCWNEFLFALAFTVTEDHQTIPVALSLLRGQHQVPWGRIFAASVIACLPVGLLVAVFQRRIVEGLTSGAVKG